jgi:hypothetical protein
MQNLPLRMQSPQTEASSSERKPLFQLSERLVHFVHMREGEFNDHRREPMHESHRRAAEQHELAANAHRIAAEHSERGDDVAGIWHAERALEYSDHAYTLAREAHTKSGKIGTF